MESNHSTEPSSLFSLPPEIIVIILSHLVTSNNYVPGRRYDDLIRATLSNSYIRQIGLATPSLWTRIEITDNPATFELAKACLGRSGEQGLDIVIRIAFRVGDKLPGVFALVKHVAGRTRELRLRIGLGKPIQWEQLNDFLAALQVPALECLALEFWDPREVGSSTRLITLPSGAGRLRSVSLVYLRPILPSPAICQLQHISLCSETFENWPLEHLWNILAQTERLETLELIGQGTTDNVRSTLPFKNRTEPAAVTPTLRRLAISGFDSGLLAYMLLNLEAPNLEEVSLVILGFKDTWTARYPWLDVIAIHSIPSVSTLEVSFLPRISPVVAAPFPKFLRRTFPNIEHLSLSRYTATIFLPFWTDILEDADALPPASCWPLLRRLTVTGSDESCESSCLEKLKICRRFLALRAKRSLPALDAVSLYLCPKTRENPQYESLMSDVSQLLN
ncbi:hypothetical protein FRC01_002475 [Tulasnella sp. 417]|nr:hypothetical protein FRC01_002475 [Tulasnella sp. 417]